MATPENAFLAWKEKAPERCDPPDLYASLTPVIASCGPRVYVTEPLTSGGFRDAFTDSRRAQMARGTIVGLNARLWEWCAAKYMDLSHEQVMLPHWVGKRTHPDGTPWGEYDYLMHCYFFITGLPPSQAQEAYQGLREQLPDAMEMMNNHALSRELRWGAYEAIADELMLGTTAPTLNPAHMLLAMPGSHQSLGCRFEAKIAQDLGIPVYQIPVSLSIEELENNALLHHAKRVGALG